MSIGPCAGEDDHVEAIILLPDQATVDVFRRGEGALDQDQPHDSASSFTGPAAACKAYAIADDAVFILCMSGEPSSNLTLHARVNPSVHPASDITREALQCCLGCEHDQQDAL